jgi:hypothetical protein
MSEQVGNLFGAVMRGKKSGKGGKDGKDGKDGKE